MRGVGWFPFQMLIESWEWWGSGSGNVDIDLDDGSYG
jgi:hypothetical protein